MSIRPRTLASNIPRGEQEVGLRAYENSPFAGFCGYSRARWLLARHGWPPKWVDLRSKGRCPRGNRSSDPQSARDLRRTGGLEFSSLEVIDADGVRQIVVLRDPLVLPAPAKSAAGQGPASPPHIGSGPLARKSPRVSPRTRQRPSRPTILRYGLGQWCPGKDSNLHGR
jgi:hypothetical protein